MALILKKAEKGVRRFRKKLVSQIGKIRHIRIQLPKKDKSPFRPVPELEFKMNWAAMTLAEQKTFFEQNGFLLIPNVLSSDHVDRILDEIADHQFKFHEEDFWAARSFVPLIDNPHVIDILKAVLGPEIVFFKGVYLRVDPPGIEEVRLNRQTLHIDYDDAIYNQDFRNTPASWINVGYYFNDMSYQCAPLWVIPGSNHRYDIVPFGDNEHMAPDARMLIAKAGDAIIFHCTTIHCGDVNRADYSRHAMFYSYRPRWAVPVRHIPEWPESLLQTLSHSQRDLMTGLNIGRTLTLPE